MPFSVPTLHSNHVRAKSSSQIPKIFHFWLITEALAATLIRFGFFSVAIRRSVNNHRRNAFGAHIDYEITPGLLSSPILQERCIQRTICEPTLSLSLLTPLLYLALSTLFLAPSTTSFYFHRTLRPLFFSVFPSPCSFFTQQTMCPSSSPPLLCAPWINSRHGLSRYPNRSQSITNPMCNIGIVFILDCRRSMLASSPSFTGNLLLSGDREYEKKKSIAVVA